MNNSAPVPTPMVVNKHYSEDDGVLLKDSRIYKQIIGALHYLINTRPDNMFAVNRLS